MADAMNPDAAAMAATARRSEISCVGASDPISHLRAVVYVGRVVDPTTVFAGIALLARVRDQSEHEALAARCLTVGVTSAGRDQSYP